MMEAIAALALADRVARTVAAAGRSGQDRAVRLPIARLGPVVAALTGCTPEPASTVEMRQTVVEIVDQGRAMAIEDAMVGLVGDIDLEMSLVDIADAMASAAGELGCTTITRPGAVAVSIEFGAIDAPCAHAGIALTGTVRR